MTRRLSASHALLISTTCLILFGSHVLAVSSVLQCKTGPPCHLDDHGNWSNNESHSEGSSLSVPIMKRKAELSVTQEIRDVLKVQRRLIAQEMKGYKFPNGRNKKKEKSLKHFTPELGGQPIRSLIFATYRTGSTFMGEVLNSHPATFYHYSPLSDFGTPQVRGEPNASQAVRLLKALFKCNYNSTSVDRYMNYGRNENHLFIFNKRLRPQCEKHPRICFLPDFLSRFCRLFPFQTMKLERLRSTSIEEILKDPSFNVRVLLLIRDPRGTLQSRKHTSFCSNVPDCSKPEIVCSDLVEDYNVAVHLKAKYPNRFRVIRYEDFCVQPYVEAKKLFQFIGLDFHPNIIQYLDTHTKVNAGGVYSTYRNTKKTPFLWRQNLTYQEVENIQRSCLPAMKRWGYRRATDSKHQRVFNPVGAFSLT